MVFCSVAPGCTSSTIVVQLEPPSNVYWIWKKAFAFDDIGFVKLNVDCCAPPTQLPKLASAVPATTGHSTRSDWTIDATVA